MLNCCYIGLWLNLYTQSQQDTPKKQYSRLRCSPKVAKYMCSLPSLAMHKSPLRYKRLKSQSPIKSRIRLTFDNCAGNYVCIESVSGKKVMPLIGRFVSHQVFSFLLMPLLLIRCIFIM